MVIRLIIWSYLECKVILNTMSNTTGTSRILTRRSFAALAIGSAGALALAACGGSSSSSSSSSAGSSSAKAAPSALPSGMGATVADGEFPRTVKHFRGETEIKEAPKKVVILSTGQLDGVLALGIVPVGAASAGDSEMIPNYLKEKYSEKASELEKIQKVGKRTDPNIGSIANLKPDLILVNNTNKKEGFYESLQKIAPTVVTEGTGVNWKQDFLLIAAALGTTEKAESLMKEYTEKAKKLGEKAGKEKTFSFLYVTNDRNRIFGVSSFVGSICVDASLARPQNQQFDTTSKDISAELLDQADGDYLFYGVQGEDDAKLTSESLWDTLQAVSQKHAHKVDSDMFYLNAGITAALGVIETIEKNI